MVPGKLQVMAIGMCAALAGCGGGGASGGVDPSWALDACKTFPVATIAKASGVAVTTAKGDASSPVKGVNVATCHYATADEKPSDSISLTLRHDVEGGRTMEGEIDGLTNQPDLTGPTEVIAMPKGKAVWQPKLRALSWLPDPDRLIVVIPNGLRIMGESDPADQMKARALQIANGLGV